MDLARKRAMNLPSAVIRSLKAHTASGALATSDVARSSLVDLEGSGSQMSSFLANQKSESIRKAVYRAKNVAPTDTIDGIDSALTPMIPPPPQIDPFAVWIFAKHFGGPVEEHYYAWTTNRMLESVHWWMQTNGKVRDGVGEVYLSFDGDHDVISAQGRSRGFTSFMKFEQEDTTLEERSASGQKRVASSQFENPRHQQRASRKPAWVHIFACVERVRVPKNSGYVHSAVPFCGIVAKSENSGVICSVLATALRIVCQDHDQRIDISGVRSDNGAAARLAASKLSSGSLCGCFAHEVFKAERRNKSWTTPFATLEVVWNTDVAGRCCAITQTLSRRSTTHGCTSFYRCPTLAHFRCFGGLLADFAEEVGCPAAAHLRVKFGPSRMPFYAAADGLPGFAAHQNAVESLHALFQTHVTGKGPHTHGTFLKSLESNVPQSYRFQRHFPNGHSCLLCGRLQWIFTPKVVVRLFDVGSSTGRDLLGASRT